MQDIEPGYYLVKEGNHGLQGIGETKVLVGEPFGSRSSGVGTLSLLRCGCTGSWIGFWSCSRFGACGGRSFLLDLSGSGVAVQFIKVQEDWRLFGVCAQGVILRLCYTKS